jgi:hypothetical protein
MNAPATDTTCTEPSHRSSDSTFIQENQPFGRDRGELRDEFLTLLEVGFGVPFAGMERLFFSRRLNLRSRYQICGRLSLTPASLRNFN